MHIFIYFILLNIAKDNSMNMIYLSVGENFIYYNAEKKKINYENQLKVGDSIESIMNLRTGVVEFKINGLTVGNTDINKNQTYIPAIMIFSKGEELELI